MLHHLENFGGVVLTHILCSVHVPPPFIGNMLQHPLRKGCHIPKSKTLETFKLHTPPFCISVLTPSLTLTYSCHIPKSKATQTTTTTATNEREVHPVPTGRGSGGGSSSTVFLVAPAATAWLMVSSSGMSWELARRKPQLGEDAELHGEEVTAVAPEGHSQWPVQLHASHFAQLLLPSVSARLPNAVAATQVSCQEPPAATSSVPSLTTPHRL